VTPAVCHPLVYATHSHVQLVAEGENLVVQISHAAFEGKKEKPNDNTTDRLVQRVNEQSAWLCAWVFQVHVLCMHPSSGGSKDTVNSAGKKQACVFVCKSACICLQHLELHVNAHMLSCPQTCT